MAKSVSSTTPDPSALLSVFPEFTAQQLLDFRRLLDMVSKDFGGSGGVLVGLNHGRVRFIDLHQTGFSYSQRPNDIENQCQKT